MRRYWNQWTLIGLLMVLVHGALAAVIERTDMQYFRPFVTGVKKTSFTRQSPIKGHCIRQSELIKREDAWVCQANGQSLDPCFSQEDSGQSQMLCFPHSQIAEAIPLILISPLPRVAKIPLDMSSAYPWGVELEDGQWCEAMREGTWVNGVAVHYACKDGSYLLGNIQRCHQPWQILQQRHQEMKQAKIRRALF